MFVSVNDCFFLKGGPCNGSLGDEMKCLVPSINISEQVNISYTVRIGAAPGPDLTREELTLDLRPNPVFAEDGSALENSEFTPGETTILRITVRKSFLLQLEHFLFDHRVPTWIVCLSVKYVSLLEPKSVRAEQLTVILTL